VRSIARSGHPDLEIIVVDNASGDDSVAHLRREVPDVQVLEMERNGGYAAALNVGIRFGSDAGATHLWFLNNDLIVAPDALEEALRVCVAVPRAGLVASVQIVPTSRETTEVAGDDAPWEHGWTYPVATHRGRLRDHHFSCDGRCHGPGYHAADVVHGAALMASAALVRAVGMLDERFFHYFEEDELAERAREAGYQNLLACQSRVWHEQGASLPMDAPQAEYYRLRNLFLLRQQVDGWSPLGLLARPGYAKAVAATWLRVRSTPRARLAFRSALRHGFSGRAGRVDIPDDMGGDRRS
jgi:GT2 family glycosyltransferase